MKVSVRRRCATGSLLIYAALLICAADVHGLKAEQPPAIQTRLRTLPKGIALSQTRVGAIVEDNNGFLWFGTQYGLNRYDGFQVREFLPESGDPKSVGCSYIHALFKDRGGRLWVSCDQSLDRYEPETESFTHFHFQSSDGAPEVIRALLEDRDGSLFLGTRHGILHFDPKTGSEVRVSLLDAKGPTEKDQDVIWIEADRANRLWAQTRHSLVRLDPTRGEVVERIPIRSTPDVGSFHEDRWGNFWLIAGYRLFSFDPALKRLTEITHFPNLKMESLGALHTMLEDADGDMWFGTDNNGVIHISHDPRSTERFFQQIGSKNTLPSRGVTALCQDRSGDIWLGFHDTAPVVLQRNRTSSYVIAFDPEVKGGLKSPLSTSLFELAPGRIIIGTSSAIQILDEETGEYSDPFPFLALRDVFDVYRDRQNRLWFATDIGIYRFDQHTKRVDQILKGSNVRRILEDRAGRLWILLSNNLLLYSSATDSFTSFAKVEEGESYLAIADSPDGTLWLGGSNGVMQVDVRAKHIQAFPYVNGGDKGPSDSRVNALRFDTQGRLWVGTQSGLDFYDPQERSFHRLAGPRELGGQIISCILEDQRHQLWMSGNQGVLNFDPATHAFEEYSSALGVAPVDLSGWGACSKSDTGRLLFGGFGGIVIFTPGEITRPSSTPGVLLTNLFVNNHPAEIGPGEILKKSITFSDRIDLNHSQNDISLEFAAMDFRNVDSERFRYRLEGASPEWVPVARGQHTLTFTHLDRKKYKLRLQAASFDGGWSEPGVILMIDIAKPWWATWWMYSTYLLCLCIAVWLAYYFRVRQLAAIFNARTEGRLRERTALARDLHDTLLQAFQGVILRFASTTTQTLDEDARRDELNAALARAEMSLIEGREAIEAMRTSPTQMRELADAFEEVARDLNFLSPAKVEIQTDLRSPYNCGYDVDEILQIGKEAIRNALQHAQATLIQVRLTSDLKHFQLLVTDDGIGIPEELVTGDVGPGHWGMRGMRERAERLGGTLTYSSRQGGGSEVRLVLPDPQLVLPFFERWRLQLKSVIGERR